MYIKVRVTETFVVVGVKAHGISASTLQAIENYTSPVIARVAAACDSAKTKSSSALEPYYMKVVDRVVHIKGTAGTKIKYVRTNVSESFCIVRTRALETLADSHQAVVGIAGRMMAKTFSAFEPYSIKFKGVFCYVRGVVGDTLVCVKVRLSETCDIVKVKILETYAGSRAALGDFTGVATTTFAGACEQTMLRVLAVADVAKARAAEVGTGVQRAAADPGAASTAGAAAALGASGAAAGLATGSVIGAACGVVPALFTFGLSIPIGAAVGGGAGLCLGGAAGVVSGGAAGYGFQRHRASIDSGVSGVLTKAAACKDYARESATSSVSYVRSRVGGGGA